MLYTTTAWAHNINIRKAVLNMCEGGSAGMQSMYKPCLFGYVRAKQGQCKSAVLWRGGRRNVMS
eukprot:15736265-Heterocapsa_arctica.AAC.1